MVRFCVADGRQGGREVPTTNASPGRWHRCCLTVSAARPRHGASRGNENVYFPLAEKHFIGSGTPVLQGLKETTLRCHLV